MVERSLHKKSPEVYHELEVSLKKFKPDFISLLKNPVSSVQFAVGRLKIKPSLFQAFNRASLLWNLDLTNLGITNDFLEPSQITLKICMEKNFDLTKSSL